MNIKEVIIVLILFFTLSAIIIGFLLIPTQESPTSPITTEPQPNPPESPPFGTVPQPPASPETYLTVTPQTITWGNLTRGQTTMQTVNITNTASHETQPLNMTSTCAIGNLTWNREGFSLSPNSTKNATFTLYVWWNATFGSFTFNITVTG